MHDLLFETIALQRIALFTKLIANGSYSKDETDIAIAWLSELTADASHKLINYESGNPCCAAGLRGGCRFQQI